MKNILLVMMLCFLLMSVHAQEYPVYEVQCKVVNQSAFYNRSFGGGEYTYKGELQPGENISVRSYADRSWFPPANDDKFIISFYKDNYFWTFPQNLVTATTNTLFGQDILTDTTTYQFEDRGIIKNIRKEMWVPVHYADVLRSQDRETLPKYEPRLLDFGGNEGGYEAVYGSSEWYDVKYGDITNGMIVFFNPIIYTHGGDFLVRTIEKYEYGYKVECFVPRDLYREYFSSSVLMPYFNWSLCTEPTVTLILRVDGEYMDIYINEMNPSNKFGTIVKIKEEFVRQFMNLIKKGNCDLSKVHFPRRASKQLNVGEECRVLENLKLRKTPATTGAVIKTLEQGSKVTILEIGQNETIDGVTAPWVKVKTANEEEGWCFGLYLQETRLDPTPEELAVKMKSNTENTAVSNEDKNQASPLPLWAWFVFIGIAVAVSGGVAVFVVRRKK